MRAEGGKVMSDNPIKAAEGVTIRIKDQGKVLELDYDGAICQHPGSLWWGTAVGFRAMQAAAQALSQEDLWSRDNLYIVSGHPGPGVTADDVKIIARPQILLRESLGSCLHSSKANCGTPPK